MKHQTSAILVILILSSIFSSAVSKTQEFLPRGFSKSIEADKDILISPDGTFTCGFYGDGANAYWFAIWFTHSIDRTVVWVANREIPVNGKGSRVTLRADGTMVLTDVDGSIVWESRTNTTSIDVERVELLNSGNLVMKDPQRNIVWQSFDSPTDTLLPNQPFTKNNKLISAIGEGQFSSAYFILMYDNDNVLKLIYDGPEVSSPYWPTPGVELSEIYAAGRTNYNSTRLGILDELGRFLSSDRLQFFASDMGPGIHRRLTLDYDGNLRLYSLNSLTGTWLTTWESIVNLCNVHGLCGRNGLCVYTPSPKCLCPPGYEMANPSNWNEGCQRQFNMSCSKSQKVKFLQLLHSDYYGFDRNYSQNISFDACRKICLEDCECEAFSYSLTGEAYCYTKNFLFNGYSSPNFPGIIYLKLPEGFQVAETPTLNGTDAVCQSTATPVVIRSASMYASSIKGIRWSYFYWFAAAIAGFEVVFALIGWWFFFRKHGVSASLEAGYTAISSQFRIFSYSELKKATNNFKDEIGRGGSGAVYKGVLEDERVVAVKRLGDVMIQGDEEFWAEVSTIGKINHMNLVRMWGFCIKGRHKLLVYEHIENHSLDRHLFSDTSFLLWKDRFRVALGTAKGLGYLHHECLEWVIHCDVKPENILLDDDFEPKIADFGLSKLSKRENKNSEFSRIRGTKGYMAPDWALNLPITAKVDVYSYGVVILELVTGIRLSNWVVKDGNQVEEAELSRIIRTVKEKILQEESWIEDIIDAKLNGEFSRNQAITMVLVGLLCVEDDRKKRPTMEFVAQTLLECEDIVTPCF